MQQRYHLRMLRIVSLLTLLAIVAQVSFVYIHYKTTGLVDTLVGSSFTHYLFMPVVIKPIIQFVFVNLAAYVVLVACIWFISCVLADIGKLSAAQSFWLSIVIWCLFFAAIGLANSYFYPHSFFAFYTESRYLSWLMVCNFVFLIGLNVICLYYAFQRKYKRTLAVSLLFLASLYAVSVGYDFIESRAQTAVHHDDSTSSTEHAVKPNIIIIGFDSLRPDFIDYYHGLVTTPNIDAFLSTATTFNEAYTPLARTYPSWITLLTGMYPSHTNARNNLVNHDVIDYKTTLAKALQQAGYQTLYASDEKRFSNITKAEGFDDVIGPRMGLNDFILGSLGDFPLTNLLVNSIIGRQLFPYNYANRAAHVTYRPDNFLALIQNSLRNPSKKPLFLAVHFCLTHWPFTWAGDHIDSHTSNVDAYKQSIVEEDKQFGKLMYFLKQQKILQHALVIIVSDHGTALGLPGDQIINQQHFQGKADDIKKLPIARYSKADPLSMDYRRDYGVNTAYGQGTSLLSLVQYRVLMAVKSFGETTIPRKEITDKVSLLDVTPTILNFLNITTLSSFDGVSLLPSIIRDVSVPSRDLFFETGDKFTYIETDHISPEKVISARINAYDVNSTNGSIYLSAKTEGLLIKDKQLGIMSDHWFYVAFPANVKLSLEQQGNKLAMKNTPIKPFSVLVDRNSNNWSVDYSPRLSTSAQLVTLQDKLMHFYSR